MGIEPAQRAEVASMEGQTVNISDQGSQKDAGDDRNRSKIKFPYNDLDEAISVARAIWDNAGDSCTRTQLAGYMGQTITSGAFRLKVATASNFGLIKSSQGKVELLELGKEIVDPAKTNHAKVKAFLQIPLYQQIFEQFDGSPLPPPAALERVMMEMGVPKKQTSTARQVFHRSATQAGFFKHGAERLVQPTFKKGGGGSETPPPGGEGAADSGKGKGTGAGRSGGEGETPQYHPFIQGLLQQLPGSEESWTAEDQVLWLQTAAHIFGMLYKRKQTIKVTLEAKQSNEQKTEG